MHSLGLRKENLNSTVDVVSGTCQKETLNIWGKNPCLGWFTGFILIWDVSYIWIFKYLVYIQGFLRKITIGWFGIGFLGWKKSGPIQWNRHQTPGGNLALAQSLTWRQASGGQDCCCFDSEDVQYMYYVNVNIYIYGNSNTHTYIYVSLSIYIYSIVQ